MKARCAALGGAGVHGDLRKVRGHLCGLARLLAAFGKTPKPSYMGHNPVPRARLEAPRREKSSPLAQREYTTRELREISHNEAP